LACLGAGFPDLSDVYLSWCEEGQGRESLPGQTPAGDIGQSGMAEGRC